MTISPQANNSAANLTRKPSPTRKHAVYNGFVGSVPDCLSLWADGNAEGLRIGDDFDRLDAIRPPAHARRPVICKLAVDVKTKYDEAGIDEKIYYDTMSDIKIWCEKTGNKGIKEYMWLRNHVRFELFRLGRLQFQLYECKNKALPYNKLPFAKGDNLINVHIPEGEKLDEEKCRESFIMAEEFFEKYFADFKYEYFFCESWLLFEGNREFMKPESNIMKFMSLFEICYSVKIDIQAIERIYGKRRLFKKNYCENTDLQRRAKQYMLDGNKLGIGIAVRKAKNI